MSGTESQIKTRVADIAPQLKFDSVITLRYHLFMTQETLPNQIGASRGLVGKHEIARHLGVTTRTIDVYMAAGRIPYFKLHRAVRFSIEDVMDHLAKTYRVGGAAR